MKSGPVPRNAGDWSFTLGWVLDLIALAALAGTSELHPALLAAVAGLLALNRLVRPSFSQGFLFVMGAAIVGGAVLAWLTWRVHPVIVAAHIAPLAQALLWYAPPTYAYRGWRFGIGFLELMLASALTADFYLPLAIVVYVVVAAVALSCTFLDQELSERAAELAHAPLPRGFITNGLVLAFLIFLSAAIIFPILPRTRGGISGGLERAAVGYTERVNVSELQGLDDGASGGPQLRLYPEPGVDLVRELYLGLLRGRTLERFDGTDWHPIRRPPRRKSLDPGRLRAGGKITIEVMRESLGSDVLPVPYGTRSVWVMDEGNVLPSPQYASGEWLDPASPDRRMRYGLSLMSNDLRYLRDERELDPPGDVHRFVPPAVRHARLVKLAASITAGATSDGDKVRQVMGYLRSEGFRATLTTSEEDERARPILRDRFTPLEEFLFIRKAGHCEWFATAAAMLLRLSGVPTRLVAGFRVSRSATGGVLTIRSGDAHAWLEAWTAEGGWRPLDPTPRELNPGSALLFFRDGYDLLSGYWFRYIVPYGEAEGLQPATQALSYARGFVDGLTRRQRTEFGIVLVAAFFVILLAYLGLRRFRGRAQYLSDYDGPRSLRRERRRMERLTRKRYQKERSPFWWELYERARFGRGRDLERDVAELRACFARIRDERSRDGRGGRAG